MSSPEMLNRIAAARRVVLAQTDLMHREFGRAESTWKYDGSRVTAVDVAISEGIFRDLAVDFPTDQYFSEELAATDVPLPVTARFSWVLDPIDGTNNFALGIVHCAIALALCEHGRPVYGVVYDLSRRTLMHGGPGFGMFDGERESRITSGALTRETLVGFHSPFDKTLMPMACGVLANFKIRGLGSATLHLAYVAAGLLDGCVDFNVKIWDLAAAIPLVMAAGGDVQFLNGEQLPMRVFDLRMQRIIYVAGSTAMCGRLRELMVDSETRPAQRL
jgi:myo-inositol-1(or 4)-monophosphatase